MEYFKNRRVEVGMFVDVYFNIHHEGYSIRCSRTKKVLARCNSVRLKDGEFRVSEKGRQKVLASRRKAVHAYIKGTFIAADETMLDNPQMTQSVYYNPYKTELFTDVRSGKPMKRAEEVFCYGRVAYVRDNPIQQEDQPTLF
ncbi:hypothetical protein BpOF4_21389 (plasmid) [Alkalihalophilus pseudofirmus OF4]|uniref:Uncharacterized protein n=1 Tax=Alkalihalophilus pseudofirmus (strain ATCC BAA-2126 / JCM 17055 / OF4) TaxID=398511 RepID=D3G1P7_ALKPO|nr:hypothetical protein [Alkalihalophilus pseudofirmus]ADC52273.1 hypothetical protein BpOF4_21389 [Alkalihalophilus pseudofirmus OF4]